MTEIILDHLSMDRAIELLKKDRELNERFAVIKLRERNPKPSERRRAKARVAIRRRKKQEQARAKRRECYQQQKSRYRSHRQTPVVPG